MKAVFYVPGVDTALMPLTHLMPKGMIPLLNRPMLEYYLLQARQININSIHMILHRFPEYVERYFKDGRNWNLNISYSLEKELQGDFWSLRKIRSALTEPFIFSDAQFFVLTDWKSLIEKHKRSGCKLSVVCKKFYPIKNHYAVNFNPQNRRLQSIEKLEHSSKEKEVFILSGLYIFDPQILELLSTKKIRLISEDLLPYLLRQNEPVNVVQIDGIFEPLTSLHYYWELNLRLLKEQKIKEWLTASEIRPGIYTGTNCKIKTSLSENVLPPVLIGSNCRIGPDVTIKGPAIIGNNVKLDRGATVEKSIIFDNTYVGKRVAVQESVVARNCYISVKTLFGTFVEENFIIGEYRHEPLKMKIDRFLIALIDRTVALMALILLLPLFIVIAILIKLDSPGPVFYVSKRLKRPAIEKKEKNYYQYEREEAVKYYVFRTMYTNADSRWKEMAAKNKYQSGPYRKIEDDPRVTRIGKILRKTSLDELPLLFNVLKGDMSLVGIWALPVYEAEALQQEGLKVDQIDLSETARVRFAGRLGLAGFWQARGRSELTAEERALHDSFQSALIALKTNSDEIGEYGEYISLKGYLKLLWETFIAVLKRKGAQ